MAGGATGTVTTEFWAGPAWEGTAGWGLDSTPATEYAWPATTCCSPVWTTWCPTIPYSTRLSTWGGPAAWVWWVWPTATGAETTGVPATAGPAA